ncbi:Gp19/Gp15/Gp42 family protein [Leifsonia sp. NPDC058194]|uniref:Gp19/Gp15/Gp42 family protein n=1 Tax=Leifsonia sp. NPDC058194 TaxID=3346374 RepID=UPI0036D838D4
MSWTDPSDVTDAWIGEDAPADPIKTQTWIDKAEREVKYRVPDIQSRISAEAAESPARQDLQQTAIDVVVAMVTRVFRNPEGIRQANTTTGPITDSVTYGGNTPGGLGLTEDELAKLQARTQGAFTISLIPPTSPFSPDYVGGVNLL